MDAVKTGLDVQSINRIRVAERIDPDGNRQVWHQGDDVDLISSVDLEGRVRRQELTLGGDYFLWVANQGLQTGAIGAQTGSSASRSSELVTLDASIDQERLQLASRALLPYTGEDKYVLHIRFVIDQLHRGLVEHAEVVITGSRHPSATGRPVVPVPKKRLPIGWIVAGALALAAAAAAGLIAFS